jgi:2,4-dienoyl-CoA reductase-like NADH-dependent reductase (Old Yellow Enzyme family)
MYETLFSPIKIRGLTLPNRIVMAPISSKLAIEGAVTDQQIAYYRERAEGGVGLVTVEYA